MAKKDSKKKKEESDDSGSSVVTIGILIIAIVGVGFLIMWIPKLVDTAVPDSPYVADSELGVPEVTVNGETIYSRDIDKRQKYFESRYGPVDRDVIVNITINEKLVLQEAKALGIEPDQALVDSKVNEWVAGVRKALTDEQINDLLKEENLTFEEYVEDIRETYRNQMMMDMLLNKTVISKFDTKMEPIEITDEEILEEYNNNKERYAQRQLSHILICYGGAKGCVKNISKHDAKMIADEVYQKLLDGEDFADLAKEYSTDQGSAANGGSLGTWYSRDGGLVKEFEDAAFALKNVNQFTRPVETEFGYHIIKLDGKRDSFDELKNTISMQMQLNMQQKQQMQLYAEQEKALAEYIDSLRENAVIVEHKKELTEGIVPDPNIQTFSSSSNSLCTIDGKPVIYMFSATWCPHCRWAGPVFDKVVESYGNQIVAYHWEMDTGNNVLTPEIETNVPDDQMQIFRRYNPGGGIPTFVFGCRYYRIGTGFEAEDDKTAEEAEFRAVIDKLLAMS